MTTRIKKKQLIYSPFHFLLLFFLTILFLIIIQNKTQKIRIEHFPILNISNLKNKQFTQYITSKNSTFIYQNKTLETTIQCVGSLYNQSCLYQNLYYIDSKFTILSIKGKDLPSYTVRTNAFLPWFTTPDKREFDSYSDLEKSIHNIIHPTVIPYSTLYFRQYWLSNVGHALFDGLYPAYVALIRFPPRHLRPFRILADIDQCKHCWTEDVYSRFGGLDFIKQSVLNQMSKGRWFVFDELVMGSGALCQRCTQPNLQLPGGVELDGSRLFRDRMYQQHGLSRPVIRKTRSSEGRTPRDILFAYIIDNKRFTSNDRKEIHSAIDEINDYTNMQLSKPINNMTKFKSALIHVFYLYYDKIRGRNMNLVENNLTRNNSRLRIYQRNENNFMAQLKILRQMDIHISGPGTGQMYQTFLSDGSVNINLGGLRPWRQEHTDKSYTSYLEQYMTSGTPYIKGLYYPINERKKGIKKDEVIKLIRKAGQLILEGFSLPVNPRENLAADGQLFTEMCEKDQKFCSLVTKRLSDRHIACLELWVEDLVHEQDQWNLGGFIDNGENISCPFNRTLLYELRKKYGIKHNSSKHWKKRWWEQICSLIKMK